MKTGARGEGRGATYAIRIAGQLGAEWAAWFDGLAITPEANGDTLLTGAVADQAALHGLLRRVRDLGLTLLALNLIADQQDRSQDDRSNTLGNCL
jgi:hypothetical protein